MLSGELLHRDAMGHETRLRQGDVQVMTTGIAFEHSVENPHSDQPAHAVPAGDLVRLREQRRRGQILAAHRAGITTVLIPDENSKDLKDVPESVLAQLVVHLHLFLLHLALLLAGALPRAPARLVRRALELAEQQRAIAVAQASNNYQKAQLVFAAIVHVSMASIRRLVPRGVIWPSQLAGSSLTCRFSSAPRPGRCGAHGKRGATWAARPGVEPHRIEPTQERRDGRLRT